MPLWHIATTKKVKINLNSKSLQLVVYLEDNRVEKTCLAFSEKYLKNKRPMTNDNYQKL